MVAPNVGDGYETPQAITDDAGNLIAAYVFAGEHPIAKISAGGAIEYYLQDSMGSVIGATGSAGTSTASIKYDSFGGVVSATGTAASSTAVGGDFRLHGMWLDEVSGLYHVRARTYDAKTGRFLSRDPVAGVMRRPESMNPYVFCNSNGWVWVDPSGEAAMTVIEVIVVGVVAGILASLAVPALQGAFRTAKALWAGAMVAAGIDSQAEAAIEYVAYDLRDGAYDAEIQAGIRLGGSSAGIGYRYVLEGEVPGRLPGETGNACMARVKRATYGGGMDYVDAISPWSAGAALISSGVEAYGFGVDAAAEAAWAKAHLSGAHVAAEVGPGLAGYNTAAGARRIGAATAARLAAWRGAQATAGKVGWGIAGFASGFQAGAWAYALLKCE